MLKITNKKSFEHLPTRHFHSFDHKAWNAQLRFHYQIMLRHTVVFARRTSCELCVMLTGTNREYLLGGNVKEKSKRFLIDTATKRKNRTHAWRTTVCTLI